MTKYSLKNDEYIIENIKNIFDKEDIACNVLFVFNEESKKYKHAIDEAGKKYAERWWWPGNSIHVNYCYNHIIEWNKNDRISYLILVNQEEFVYSQKQKYDFIEKIILLKIEERILKERLI